MVVIKGLNTLMDAHAAKVSIDTMMQTLNNAQTARSQAAILLNMILKKKELSVDERKILMEKLE
jgi:hypothetical protein